MDDKTDLISIVVPVYNLEKLIGKCIESIINQTYKNLEIIIVNDGSNDNSDTIIKRYLDFDQRIKYIYQKNAGPGSAYNKGLDLANGEYVYIIDGDNFIDNTLIDILYNQLLLTNADISMCNYYVDNYDSGQYTTVSYIGNSGKLLRNKEEIVTNIFNLYKEYMWQSPCNKLYKRSLISKLRFEENRDFMMIVDTDFNLRVLKSINSIVLVNKPLVHYVQYPKDTREQITSLWKKDYKKTMINCECRLYNYLYNYHKLFFDNKRVESIKIVKSINNYFAARFIKILQLLILDKNLNNKKKKEELYFIKTIIDKVFYNREITYKPYNLFIKFIFSQNILVVKYIFTLQVTIMKYFPGIFKYLKVG